MGIKDRRRILRVGNYSKAITLPAKLAKGEEVTLAANRLIILDPRGEIHENDLLDFLETIIEPQFWKWRESVNVAREYNLQEGGKKT